MSNPRWKSSQKSLFVRTIWTKGHHHAILYKNDPLANVPFSNNTYRRKKSALTTRTNPECKPNPKALMNVPTFSILLSQLSNRKHNRAKATIGAKSAQIVSMQRSVTVEVIPSHPITQYNINREVSFNDYDDDRHLMRIQQFKSEANLSSSRSVSVHSKDVTEKYNSLSKRVMVWLDLAAQNGEDIPRTTNKDITATRLNARLKIAEIPNLNRKGRIVTAHICSNLNPRHQIIKYTSNKLMGSNERSQIINNIESTQKGSLPNAVKSVEINNNTTKSVDMPVGSQIELQASSPTFDEPVHINKFDTPKRITRADRNKRQLHIFIPNVSKKLDSDGLSSRSSSLLVRTKI